MSRFQFKTMSYLRTIYEYVGWRMESYRKGSCSPFHKNSYKCKIKIKKSFTKILTIILSVKLVLTLRVKLPCPKCKIWIVREILVSEKNRKKDGRCIGAST